MDERHPHGLDFSPLFIALLGFISTAIILTIYQCIAVGCCSTLQRRQGLEPEQEETNSGLENSTVQLIPAFKYTKESGLVEKGHDGTCAVCLSEFNEGDEVRILPECAHFFHMPCIDMWLSSHTNCPLCRTNATATTPPEPVRLPLPLPLPLPPV